MKIGIISFAHMHAYSYADSLEKIPKVELSAIYDDNQERGKKAAKSYGAAFYDNLDDFLAADFEAVIITSENSKHKEHVLKSAAAGKHILCEKPIATTVSDAEEMIKVCKEHEVILQIAFPVRFCDAIVEAKKRYDQKELGEIKAFITTNRGKNPGGWFVDKEMSGGGAVLDHTVHMVDIVRWFMGVEVRKVHAEIDTMFSDIKIDDAGIINLEFENGVFMTHDCSWSKNITYPTWGDVTMEIIGSEGTLTMDAFKDHFVSYHDEGNPSRELFSGSNMNLALINDFVDCVREGREPSITGYDGLKVMEIALAAYDSFEKKSVVEIKDRSRLNECVIGNRK